MMSARSVFSTKLPPARADLFPACKHFFPALQGAGTYAQEDVIGGVKGARLGWSAVGEFGVAPTWTGTADGHNLAITAGQWADTGTKVLIFLGVGRFANQGAIWAGDSATSNEIAAYAGHAIFGGLSHQTGCGGTTHISPGWGAGTPDPAAKSLIGMILTPGTNIKAFYYTPSAGYVLGSAGATTPETPRCRIDPADSYDALAFMPEFYGKEIWAFDSVPADMAVMCAWTYGNRTTTRNKTLYPGWIGKT